jgi:hypothetical protein
VLELSAHLWRIYFAGRNAGNQASVLAVDVDPSDGMRVRARHLQPMLPPGLPGTFDFGGSGPSCALTIGGRVHLYYTGISRGRDVRFHLAIGLALSDDGLTFTKAFDGPVRGAGPLDPFFVSVPCVRRADDGYRMWYVSGTGWNETDGALEPTYEIRSCRSPDGVMWEQASTAALPAGSAGETALGRPWVSADGTGLRLWYSRRGHPFRRPGDGAYRLASRRVDVSGAAVGEAEPVAFENPPGDGDFDGWMQAYCCVVPFEGMQVMFYNGNGFGEAGFGWAVREAPNV